MIYALDQNGGKTRATPGTLRPKKTTPARIACSSHWAYQLPFLQGQPPRLPADRNHRRYHGFAEKS